MYECRDCWRSWNNWSHRKQHLDATGHDPVEFECDECCEVFDAELELYEHMNKDDHWGSWRFRYECYCCYDTFKSEEGRKDHQHEEHLFCETHDQFFQNGNNLNQHLKSKKHAHERPDSPVCPFCQATYNTATGLVHHVERGTCPSAPTNREALYQAIRRRDPQGVISKKLLEYPASDNTTYSATERAYNNRLGVYECYICHRTFAKLNSLNQHLGSPVHQQNLYHCPGLSCEREFTTLGGLVNHFESESCGCMRFSAVQNRVGQILDSSRMISR